MRRVYRAISKRWGVSSPNGASQETKELYDLLSAVRTPYLSDVVVEDAVREAGKYYMQGRCSLEETVELVQKKIAIYMSE